MIVIDTYLWDKVAQVFDSRNGLEYTKDLYEGYWTSQDIRLLIFKFI